MRLAGSIAAATMVLMFGGCLDRSLEVSSGEYAAAGGVGTAARAAAGEIRQLTIDREQQMATLALSDGSEIVVSFVARPREEWAEGCPTNLASTRMEVLDVAEGTLAIGPLTMGAPVLVRDCPGEPNEVVLREDGRIGEGGAACAGAGECIRFELASKD